MKKGFTLIELLIVIAIIAVLSVVVILVLNPAQLLAQARDSNRISDMNTLKSAMLLYLNDATSPAMASSTTFCYTSTSTAVTANCRFALTYSVAAAASSTGARNINGTGWVGGNTNATGGGGPIFSSISSGAPFPLTPIDPVNNATFFYSYVASTTPSNTFKFGAHMESTKYQSGGSGDVESTDGGTNAAVYEAGTNLNL